MKCKSLLLFVIALALTSCSNKPNNNSNSEDKPKEHNVSALLEHIEELSENIQYVPNFQTENNDTPSSIRRNRVTSGDIDYTKDNPTYSPLRSLDVKEANERIEYLKEMRNKIITNTYMLDTWIKISNDGEMGPEQRDEYKRISFDKTLDVAKLEYVSQSKTHVEGDFDDEITKYVFLKSSYDDQNRLVIDGCETQITWFKNAVREDRGYYQNSFSYREDNYLNYLTESDVTYSQEDKIEHVISLMSADLTKENPVLTYLNSVEVKSISTGKSRAFFLDSTLYDEGEIAYSKALEKQDNGSGSYIESGQERLFFQDHHGKSVCEFIRRDYETNGGSFLLDLTEMSGIVSFIGNDEEIVLTLEDDKVLKIVDITTEGDSRSGTAQGITLNYATCKVHCNINFSSMLELTIEPKTENTLNLQTLLFQIINSLKIWFKNTTVEEDYWAVLNNLDDVAADYNYYDGNVLEPVTFEQAEGIFKKYVDDDVKSFDEVRAIDLSEAINEDDQEDDEGAYSIYSATPTGQITFDKETKKIDLSDVNVTLEGNPLMRQGDEFTFVAALKGENGGIYKVLDRVTNTYKGEDVMFTLSDDIALPELDYGAYRLVCYLLDSSGNKASKLFYPTYLGEEVLLVDDHNNLINIRNKSGFFVSRETSLLGNQSLTLDVARGEHAFDMGTDTPLVLDGDLYTIKGPHVYLNTSYYLEGKDVTLTLYAVKDGLKTPLVSKEGFYGVNGVLEIDETLFMYTQGQFVQLKSELPNGTYTFVLELVVSEDEYKEEISLFDCEILLAEDVESLNNIEKNEQENNFFLTINL